MIIDDLQDTIVAQSTPPGIGGIGILRISGTEIDQVCQKILKRKLQPRYATYLPFYGEFDQVIDHGIAIYFIKPNSFTGENVLELHAHGGQIIIDILMENILKFPRIRVAYPGEFTKRAFLNNKIDLIQAESICELIHANTREAARNSVKYVEKNSKFSKNLFSIKKMVEEIQSLVEIKINFPEENLSFSKDNLSCKIQDVILKLENLIDGLIYNSNVSEFIKISIVGKPNSGKSSLMNILSEKEASIVTSIRGTTRDIIKENIHIHGVSVQISDTAGIRRSKNEIERIGIKKALKELKESEHVLYVTEDVICKNFFSEKNNILSILKKNFSSSKSFTIIKNKIDIDNLSSGIKVIEGCTVIFLSSKTKDGLEMLKTHLKKILQNRNHIENKFLSKHRYRLLLKKSLKHLKKIENVSNYSIEILAEEIKLTNEYLDQIFDGRRYYPQNMLNDIFSNFCIGK
ncbi:tRNA uridine-5-carboxymethylaminomethyl(34) synthesis GTPase MnmE [Candidatus Riesia pediculicola]|nr:tRNA uridine-5-carboxymethylaminomethyl(34) synthesis GTPase MnmE [Candidatus Riesia pediculicola]QOJ86329.1 tRNA uridine-5-carboxymethylaminomethyl(34) synthesis GTPase MnmE [Candidatus Riesia pediculicola]